MPIFIVVALAGVLLNENYWQSGAAGDRQQRCECSAAGADVLRGRHIDDSKAVSYDGTVRDAYRTWLQTATAPDCNGTVTDYLSQSFTRGEIYQAVFIHFWNVDASAYVLSDGTTSFGLLRQCRECPADHGRNGRRHGHPPAADRRQMYMARNLLTAPSPPCQRGDAAAGKPPFLPLDSANRWGICITVWTATASPSPQTAVWWRRRRRPGTQHYQAKTEDISSASSRTGKNTTFSGKIRGCAGPSAAWCC